MLYLEKPDNFSPRFEVVGCFIQYEDTFILLHRQSHKPQGETWGRPAGKIDPGESVIDAVAREVQEEIGLVLAKEHIVPVASVYVRHHGYDLIHHMCTYIVTEKPPIILNPIEHSEYRWVTAKEALTMPLIDDEAPCIKMIYPL